MSTGAAGNPPHNQTICDCNGVSSDVPNGDGTRLGRSESLSNSSCLSAISQFRNTAHVEVILFMKLRVTNPTVSTTVVNNSASRMEVITNPAVGVVLTMRFGGPLCSLSQWTLLFWILH